MQLSETIKLHMTKEQKDYITLTMNEYIKTVNSLVSVALMLNLSADIQLLMYLLTFPLL